VTNTLANDLIQRFKATFTGVPEWAWPFKPSIPLVGENYTPGKGLLIYASAENLSWLNNETPPPFFTNEDVWNRYRVCYEENGRNSDDFFPNVGIQPVNDGGLFAAGLFTSQKMGLPTQETPRSFLETIVVSNWCKFSVQSTRNKDHISHTKKLADSLPYVIGELALLQPAVVLIPKPVWIHTIFQAAMRGASPRSKFLPVPQFNANVVNCHLSEYSHLVNQLQTEKANTSLALWMEKLERVNRDITWRWRYIAMLSSII